jgi:hypothetical protein
MKLITQKGDQAHLSNAISFSSQHPYQAPQRYHGCRYIQGLNLPCPQTLPVLVSFTEIADDVSS